MILLFIEQRKIPYCPRPTVLYKCRIVRVTRRKEKGLDYCLKFVAFETRPIALGTIAELRFWVTGSFSVFFLESMGESGRLDGSLTANGEELWELDGDGDELDRSWTANGQELYRRLPATASCTDQRGFHQKGLLVLENRECVSWPQTICNFALTS